MNKTLSFILIAFSLTALVCVGVAISMATYFYLLPIDTKDYAIIIDAGSSGSRMYIYEWHGNYRPDKQNKQSLLIKQLSFCIPEKQGIDKIKNKTELIQKFTPCMNKAHSLIPENRKNRTKISLAATAGMRLLTYNSPNISEEIFANIRDYFRTQSGFLFINDSQVKIISGREEALNAWISANYFENNFENLKTTKGIIDLGGASTQIVFVPKNADTNSTRNIRIFDTIYPTYSQSFLCYGMNEATLMYQTDLIKKNQGTSTLPAHCFPKDSAYNLTSKQLKNSPCVNGDIYQEDSFSGHIFAEDVYYVTMKGESSFEQCSADIRKLFDKKQKCKPNVNIDKADSCTFENVFIADVKSSKFLALSSFWYAISNLNQLLNRTFDYDIDTFRNATIELCAMNMNELMLLNAKNGADIEKFRLERMCFSNVYVLELLAKYGFDSLNNVQVVDKIKGFTVGWTLGYLINELNSGQYLPNDDAKSTTNETHLSSSHYLIALSAFLTLTILFVAFILFLILKSNNNNNYNNN